MLNNNKEGIFEYTNHCVNRLKEKLKHNENREIRALFKHIEMYQKIIFTLLNNNDGSKKKNN